MGTPSPQMCLHIWQAWPSPGSLCPALQLPVDAVSHRQLLASKPSLCCGEGMGLQAGFPPLLCSGSRWKQWAQLWLWAPALYHLAESWDTGQERW